MRLAGVCLVTAEVRALGDFYALVLGVEAVGDATHMELRTEGAGMAIFSAEGMEEMAPGSMAGAGRGSVVLEFVVDDVDAEYERLTDLGVVIVKPLQTHPWGARSFWFRDPDGNLADFVMVPAPQPA
jgi:uncharacterized glyoxalase superfamily protein PhnB